MPSCRESYLDSSMLFVLLFSSAMPSMYPRSKSSTYLSSGINLSMTFCFSLIVSDFLGIGFTDSTFFRSSALFFNLVMAISKGTLKYSLPCASGTLSSSNNMCISRSNLKASSISSVEKIRFTLYGICVALCSTFPETPIFTKSPQSMTYTLRFNYFSLSLFRFLDFVLYSPLERRCNNDG